MILSYNTAEKTIVALNDLIKINNDRIACYEQALGNERSLDADMKRIFKDVIAQTNDNKQQLINKVRSLSRNPKDTVTISGVLHRAWTDLKVTLVGNTRTSIINFCLYNEEIARHTYEAALNVTPKMSSDVYDLIANQHKDMKRTYELIKSYREARHYLSPSLVYFN